MSKRKRTRRSPIRRHGIQAVTASVGDLFTACQHLLDDAHAEGRLLLSDSPALGAAGAALRRVRMAGSGGLPVALVEPLQTSWPTAGAPGLRYDLRIGIAVKLGLGLLTGTAAAAPPAAPAWKLRRTGHRLELSDPTDAVLAEFTVPDEPAWFAAAGQRGKAVVIYGPRIGVRRPGSVPARNWDDNARAAELDEFKGYQMVAWGVVPFASQL